MENNKKCTRCEEIKPITEFNNSSWCKSCYKEYNKEYYKNNKDYFTEYNKLHNAQNKGHFLYIVLENKGIRYVGSTSNYIKRVSSHLCLSSNIAEYMKLGTWSEIKVLDISDQVTSKQEREFLEYILIESICPHWNQKMANVTLSDDTREEELTEFAYEILEQIDLFITYKTNDNNKPYYIDIDMDSLEDFAPDMTDICRRYAEDEEYWE